ncbi:MAG: hypothetical protein IJF72_03210 [Clostridia bacterium]|nr:hypothetical protein [Clostridia bacterium]
MKLNKVLAFTLVAVLLLTTLTACGHEHTFSADWQKDATHHWHAASCEHDEEIDGYAEHEWNQGQVTTQPTCEDEGVKTFTCTVCGQTKTESIAVTSEHTFASEWSFDDDNHWHAATCEHDEEVSALAEHDWDEGEITTPATATEDGVMTYTCTVCGHSYTEAIPATGGGEQGGGSLAAPIRIEAENATLGQIDGASNPIQIEENAGCSGGRGVGYFQASGQTITFTIVVDEAVNGVTLVLGVAPAVMDMTTCEIASMSAAQLATFASFQLNGTAITFAGDTLPGNGEMNFWLVGTFTATVNLQAGTNTFIITSRGTALNVDYIEVR